MLGNLLPSSSQLFDIVKDIKNVGEEETERRKFFFYAPKGTFEEYKELYPDKNEKNLKEWFASEQGRWYEIQFQYLDVPWYPGPYYGVFINSFYVLSINDRNEKEWPEIDAVDFINELIEIATETMKELRAGTYNERMEKELSYNMKYGKVSRKDYWDAYPEEREKYNFTEHELEVLRNAKDESIPPVTAREYYEMCGVCYDAAGLTATGSRFEDTDEEHNRYGEITPKEKYYRFADGRDERLSEVALDDKEDFQAWLHHKEPYTYIGGHPFEIYFSYSGKHSVHLYAYDNDICLTGGEYPSNVMAAKMYVGLVDNGYSVRFYPESILERIDEKDNIGIIPSYVWYNHHFDDVNDTIVLDKEDYEKLKDKIRWEEIPKVCIDEK